MADTNTSGNSPTADKEAVTAGENGPQPSITIDDKKYTLESLGHKGREQLQNLRAADEQIKRLQDQLAITQTARNTYARHLAEVVKDVRPVQ